MNQKRWASAQFGAPGCSEKWKFSTVLDLELSQIAGEKKIHPFQRGHWVIPIQSPTQESNSDLQRSSSWNTVRDLLSAGKLPHCNAVHKSEINEVWVYSTFCHALQVHEVLKKNIPLLTKIEYSVPDSGVILFR